MDRVNYVTLCEIAVATAVGGIFGMMSPSLRRWIKPREQPSKIDDDKLDKQLFLSCQVAIAQQRNAVVTKYLSQSLVDYLRFKRTSNDASLFDVLRTGFAYPHGTIGCLAVDEECYSVFDELFDPVICDCQDHFALHLDKQPYTDFGETHIDTLKPFEQVVSMRLQLSRNLRDTPFLPLMSENNLEVVEQQIIYACGHLQIDPQLRGKYIRFDDVDEKLKSQLLSNRLFFGLDNPVLKAAGAYKHGSKGRGIYVTADRTLAVFVNETDHLTIVSVNQQGEAGQLRPVYERFVRAYSLLERHLVFARDPKLGMLTVSPDRVGTGLVASARMRLPVLSRRADLQILAKEMGLRERVAESSHAVDTAMDEKERTFDGVHEFETPRTLGLTEWAIVRHFHQAVGRLLATDKDEQCPTFMHMYS